MKVRADELTIGDEVKLDGEEFTIRRVRVGPWAVRLVIVEVPLREVVVERDFRVRVLVLALDAGKAARTRAASLKALGTPAAQAFASAHQFEQRTWQPPAGRG